MSNLKLTIKNNQCNHVEIYTYPDGQKNIKLDMEYFNDPKMLVDIVCSIRNFSDLEILLAIVAALRKNDYVVESIYFVYLFGMRSDRAFDIGMPNYFRDVVAPIINSLPGFKEFFYPHGTIAINYIENASDTNSLSSFYFSDKILICGDKSASKIFDISVIYFHKKRNNGQIAAISLSDESKNRLDASIEKYPDKPLMIIDDLCDGGATFIAEAEYLRMIYPEKKLYLFVAHGIFSKGIRHVLQYFDKIITTNSYCDYKPEKNFEIIEVI